MTQLRDAILLTVAEFCRDTGMSADALGRRAAADHHLISRIGRGACTLRRLERLESFMRAERRRLRDQK